MTARRSVRFVTQRYWPSTRATAQLVTDLAEELASSGYDVSVLCAAEDGSSVAAECRHGVAIRRLRTSSLGRTSLARRAIDLVGFYIGAFRALIGGHPQDLVIFLTAPPFVAVLGRINWALRRRPYAVWSHDLHPEAEFADGILKAGSLVGRLLQRIDEHSYREAQFVVDLGRCMKRRLRARGVQSDRLLTIPIWSRSEEVEHVDREANPLRGQLGIGTRFVVMYSGNAGLAHCFEEVLEVMKRLRNEQAVMFLFVGDGVRRREIELFADTHGIGNFRYLPYFSRDMIRYSLSLGDVHLVTLRPEMTGIAVPSKVSGIMGVARPVIMVGAQDSEVALAVKEAQCGVVIDPRECNAADRLEGAIRSYMRDPHLCASSGKNARRYFENHFAAEGALERWRDLLKRHFSRAAVSNGSLEGRLQLTAGERNEATPPADLTSR